MNRPLPPSSIDLPARGHGPLSCAEPRVVFLTHTGQIGGAEICLINIVQAFEGSVLLFEDGPLHERLIAHGVHVVVPTVAVDMRAIRRDRGLLKALPLLAGIAGLIRHISRAARQSDVVYCNSQKSFVLGALASLLNRVPLLWHLHDILDASHFGRLQIRLVVMLANLRAARVVVPSRAVADAFVAAGGRASLVAVVANGVSVPPAAPGPLGRAEIRRRLGLPDGFLLGVFSRLAPWKGQDVVIKALTQLPDGCCIIAGDALFGEIDYARALRALAERLGVAHRVRFLGQRDDVADLMQAVDVVVHPSINPEPFGLTLVEAMLAETPVVASDAGAAGEILAHGRAGMLVTPADATALAEAIERCRLPSDALDGQVRVARQRATQNYSVERLRREVHDLVTQVAAASRLAQSDRRRRCDRAEGRGQPSGDAGPSSLTLPAPGMRRSTARSSQRRGLFGAHNLTATRATSLAEEGGVRRPDLAAAEPDVCRPRVLFLTHTGQIGGAEVGLLNVAGGVSGTVLLFQHGPLHERLLGQGSHVVLAHRRPDLRAIRRNRGLLNIVPVLHGVTGLVRQINRIAGTHDLVFCNTQKSFVLGAIASWLNRTPILWHLHDILDASHFGAWHIRLVVGLANRRAARVVVVSGAVADAFVAAGGRPDLVTVVLNGVRVPPTVTDAAEREALRRELGLPTGFLFGVFSRLAKWKGQHVALDALAALPDAGCIVVGGALFGEDDYERTLREQVERLGLGDRVRFLGHRLDVPRLMQAVDVVVHPSIHPEPFGRTLVEAMLAGTPLVASDNGAAAEILDGGRLGGLVPPGDVAAMAAAIERCRDRPPDVAWQVTASRLHAEQHFGEGLMLRQMRRVVLEIACS